MPKEENLQEDYIRVGIYYFKKIQKTDPGGFSYPVLEKWSKETIKDDFSTKDQSRPYLQVPRYDQFCNVPDNSSAYTQVHGKAYNIYQKPTHQPQPGNFDKTLNFLRHIYGTDYLDFGLDYLTILWRYPRQRLPVHCLVSQEQKTGKSTFLHWLQAIFQSNMAIIQNQDFEGQFNAHYATKNYLAVDETQVDIEKKATSEKIKFITTSPSTFVNFKGVDKKEVQYYGKLFLNSNHEEDFIYVEQEDTRYFIHKVKPIQEENPDILSELVLEIPAFLHHLAQREIVHPRKSRLWFAPEVYRTEARQAVIEHTKPKYQRVVDDFIRECFYTFEDANELFFAPKDIWEQVKEDYRHIDPYKIRDYLRKSRKMQPHTSEKGNVMRYECYRLQRTQNLNGSPDILIDYKDSRVGRPYRFKREDWLEKAALVLHVKPLNGEEASNLQKVPISTQNGHGNEEAPF